MVRIGGDIGGIELESGDTITVNGNDWVYQSDGTLEGPELNVGTLSIGGGEVQSSLSGYVVPIAQGLSSADAIDPSSTSTPVQDAADAVSNNGLGGAGTVLLPPTTVQDAGPIRLTTGVDIKGWGVKYGAVSGTSVVEISSSGTTGLEFDGAVTNGKHLLDGFVLQGQGDDAAAADAITVVNGGGNIGNLDIGQLLIEGWYGRAIDAADPIFQSRWENLIIQQVDAGDHSNLIFISGGPGVNIDMLTAYPTATTSASNSNILSLGSTSVRVGFANIGGSPSKILGEGGTPYNTIRIDGANYEPSNHQSEPSELIDVKGRSTVVGPINVTAQSVQDVFWLLDSPGDYKLSVPQAGSGGTISRDKVRVINDTAASGVYYGDSADVTNATGSTLSNPVSCLGDQTLFT